MEAAREIETKRLINQVNLLIDKVEFLLDTATEATFLNDQLELLSQWGNVIYTNIQDNPDLGLLSKLKSSGPLYVLMLTAQMPSKTRESISQYCEMIAKLREWAKSNVTVLPPQEPKVKRKPGRPHQQNRTFSEYIATEYKDKSNEIIAQLAMLMQSTSSPTRKLWAIRAALKERLLGDKPCQRSVEVTFGISCSKSLYNDAFNKQPSIPDIYNGYITRLKEIKSVIG